MIKMTIAHKRIIAYSSNGNIRGIASELRFSALRALFVSDILAFVSGLIGPRFLPMWDADIFALASSVCFLPVLISLSLSLCSSDMGGALCPLPPAEIFALCSSVSLRPIFIVLSRSFSASVTTLLLLPSAIFALVSGECLRPVCAMLILALVSGLKLLPLRAFVIFSPTSGGRFCPLFDRDIFSFVSDEWGLRSLAFAFADMIFLSSSLCLYPSELPAIGQRLYSGREVSI